MYRNIQNRGHGKEGFFAHHLHLYGSRAINRSKEWLLSVIHVIHRTRLHNQINIHTKSEDQVPRDVTLSSR